MDRLNVSVYGARDAAFNWHKHYKQHLVGLGRRQGAASPCPFHHEKHGVRVFIHWGARGYVASGVGAKLDPFAEQMGKHYERKVQIMGPGPKDDKQVGVRN